MAYTTDRTWVTGEVVTAALMNTYIRDNFKWLSTDKPMCRAYRTTTLAVANNTITAVPMDAERFDNASMHDTSTNTARITVSTANAGKYVIGGHCDFAGSTLGTYRRLILRLNGSAIWAYQLQPQTATNGVAHISLASFLSMSNEYFELTADQDTGGNLNVNAGTPFYYAEVWAVWVGV